MLSNDILALLVLFKGCLVLGVTYRIILLEHFQVHLIAGAVSTRNQRIRTFALFFGTAIDFLCVIDRP